MDERTESLGFTPQKESPYTKLLPYADALDKESNEQLSEIKAQLGRSVQMRDIKIGTTHWTGQLSKYIRLYGFKFSKDDHLHFIKVLFGLITAPKQDVSLVQKFSLHLVTLLKKKELLSRSDLELPWQPLHELVESVVYSQYDKLFPTNIENTLKSVVAACRMYFSLESTQEMLDEWRPLLCPFDTSMLKGMFYFEQFLPTLIPPEQSQKGYKLWFKEFVELWDSCHNTPSWELQMVSIFSRLADDNIGYIDWDPYIPKIFTRVLRSFNLPVGTGSVQVARSNSTYDIGKTVTWMVAMMGNGSACQDHLDRMFRAMSSFYHPSNTGKWHNKLFAFMQRFPITVVKRLKRERIKKPLWQPPIPEVYQISDTAVTRFVVSIKPIILQAMFSKLGSGNAGSAFHHLAVLRPELIIPPLLERTYPAMETLTEPHRLIACLNCTVSVSRSMLKTSRYYEDGAANVLPLMNLCLPGIDPNDTRKALTTFQLVSTLASLVPIVDCSEAVYRRDDLTEREKELCSASAQFEDFVLQFIDRLFVMIESCSSENARIDSSGQQRINHEEAMLEVGMLSTFNALMQQSSIQIYQQALNRLFNFASQRFFEIRVAGRFTAALCRAAAKVNPKDALAKFVPHMCRILKTRMENEDIAKDEHLDTEFMWHLKILSEVVRCDGNYLIAYKADLVDVLKGSLHLKCKDAADMAGSLLCHVLRALTLLYALDYKSVPVDWDRPVEEYLAIRDWGKSGDINNLQLKWHIPSVEEKQFSEELIEKFLKDELVALQKHVSKEQTLDREELSQRLGIISQCIMGAGAALPSWEGEAVNLVDSLVDLHRFGNTCHRPNSDITLHGQNVRETVLSSLKPLLDHILETSEDDTKSLLQVLKVYATVLFFHGTSKDDFDGRWKSLHIVKKSMENKLLGPKHHIRALLVDRIQLQHELRVMHRFSKTFTSRHKEIFCDLFRLSVSRYPEVRKKAQATLGAGFHLYAYSYRTVIQELVECLKEDPSIEHHKLKGALFVMLGQNKRSLITKRNWEMMNLMWPAIVQAQHSEKPSILKLVDQICDKLHHNVETTEIWVQVPDSSISAVSLLWETSPTPSHEPASETEIARGLSIDVQRSEDNLKSYQELVHTLCELLESGNLRWKSSQIAMEMIGLLTREDTSLPIEGVRVFVKNLNHETIQIRKICINGVSAVLKQQKRKHKKCETDPYALAGCSSPIDRNDVHPGDRPDNQWHHYSMDNLLETQETWDACTFVDKTHFGYYTWPRKFLVYAPYTEQPNVDRNTENLTEEEQVVYEHFLDSKYVDKLVDYLSQEEQKGKDKFHPRHFILFKGLFRNFGDSFMELFRVHLERLVEDTKPESHETSHRCAAEIISGILRGTKHWPYQKLKSLYEWLIPVLKTALSNMTTESIVDWGTCFATASESRDPRKISPWLNLLLDNPLRGDGGSFGDSSRLYVLQGALSQQEWRVPALLEQILVYLEPNLTYAYKNVRDRMGSLLTSIFLYDFSLPSSYPSSSPKKSAFIESTLSKLDPLKDILMSSNGSNGLDTISLKKVTAIIADKNDVLASESNSVDSNHDMEMDEIEGKSDKEKKDAIKLCKTVMKWLQGSFGRMLQCSPPDVFKYLPLLTLLTSESTDDELRQDCVITLACMAQSLVSSDVIPVLLKIIQEVSKLPTWHARGAILTYVQVMVFCNLFLMQEPQNMKKIKEIVLALLCDEQLEVRELAALTLGGFLHCAYFEMDKELMTHFETLCSTKIKRGKDGVPAEKIIARHAGVLGLSACIQAFPYDVPEFMPRILMDLSGHLDDPQPIQMTVKKTLSNFRRTHHDNWQDHKQKFSDDQLVVLTDLLVSPNYYA